MWDFLSSRLPQFPHFHTCYIVQTRKKKKSSQTVLRFKIQTGCCKFPTYNVAPPSPRFKYPTVLGWFQICDLTSKKGPFSGPALPSQGFPDSKSSQMSSERSRRIQYLSSGASFLEEPALPPVSHHLREMPMTDKLLPFIDRTEERDTQRQTGREGEEREKEKRSRQT